ncbi:MAG TPA: DUF302 domain-containing protein [Acidiferrobacteraceae bacterium]|nr:DUF302 domain-containing protein [Acidiferrobacteraceae bacterium]
MKSAIIISLLSLLITPLAQAGNGIITKKSVNSVTASLDCLEKTLKAKGLTVFARVNHTAGAKKVGLSMRPTQLLIFGNPKMGTPLMNSNQTMGLDLPMKALAWEDAKGQVWISYNDPAHLAARHSVADKPAIIKKMTGALGKFTDKAAAKGC